MEDFADEERLEGSDMVAVVISSHGSMRNNRQQIYFSNGALVALEDLITPVLTCPALLHRPKLFIIQACRGNFNRAQGHLPDNAVFDPNRNREFHSTKDRFMFFSSATGNRSWRQAPRSPFLACLADTIREYGRTSDLELIAKIVCRVISEHTPPFAYEDPDRVRQYCMAPEITHCITKRVLFHNFVTADSPRDTTLESIQLELRELKIESEKMKRQLKLSTETEEKGNTHFMIPYKFEVKWSLIWPCLTVIEDSRIPFDGNASKYTKEINPDYIEYELRSKRGTYQNFHILLKATRQDYLRSLHGHDGVKEDCTLFALIRPISRCNAVINYTVTITDAKTEEIIYQKPQNSLTIRWTMPEERYPIDTEKTILRLDSPPGLRMIIIRFKILSIEYSQ